MENLLLPFGPTSSEWVAGIYARVSTDHEEQQTSKVNQIQFFDEAHCKSYNIKSIYNYYPEENMSGTKTEKRTEFKRLLQDAKDGRINCIIAKSISRFARNQVDTIKTIRELHAIGVRFIFIEQAIDTIRDTQMLGLFAWMAEEESRTISKRRRFGGFQSAKSGHFTASIPALGYKIENKKLAIVPEEAEIVRKVYDMFESGIGILKITNFLNSSGYKTRSGAAFRKSRIVYMLRNEAYKGWIVYGKRMNADVTLNKSIRKSKDQWTITQNAHEPIIDEDRFDKIQGMFQDTNLKMSKKAKSIFAGVVKCKLCGSGMTKNGGSPRALKDGSKKYYFYYRCNRKTEVGIESCNSMNIREDHLKVILEEKLRSMKSNIGQLESYKKQGVQTLREKLSAGADAEEINKKIEKINTMRSSLTDKYLEDKIADDLYQKKEQEFTTQINSLIKEKSKYVEFESIVQDFETGMDNYISTVVSFESAENLDNYMIRNLVDAIYVDDKGNIEIVMKFKNHNKDNQRDNVMEIVPTVKTDNTNLITNNTEILNLPNETLSFQVFKNAHATYSKHYRMDSKVILSEDDLYMIDEIKEIL